MEERERDIAGYMGTREDDVINIICNEILAVLCRRYSDERIGKMLASRQGEKTGYLRRDKPVFFSRSFTTPIDKSLPL